MDKKFIKISEEIYKEGEKLSRPIPPGVNKYKGELGLLPEDIDIRAWQIPPTSAMLLRFLILAIKAKIIL